MEGNKRRKYQRLEKNWKKRNLIYFTIVQMINQEYLITIHK